MYIVIVLYCGCCIDPRRIRAVLRGCLVAMLLTMMGASEPEVVQMPKVRVSAAVPLVKTAEFRMLERRFAPAAAAYGGFIYIIGGLRAQNEILDSIERFDPRTGQSEIVAHLSIARLWHRAVVANDRIYVLGGTSAYGRAPEPVESGHSHGDILALHSVEIFDPRTGAVSRGDPLPEAVSGFGCVAIDAKIYVIGGVVYQFPVSDEPGGSEASNNGTVIDEPAGCPGVGKAVRIYDTVTRRWTFGMAMPTPRENTAVAVDGRSIIVLGGYDGKETFASVDVFDVPSQAWQVRPALCRSTRAESAIAIDRSLFLFGDYRKPRELLVYNLTTGDSETFPLNQGTIRNTAAVLLDRKIYLIGGREGTSTTLNSIRVFALRKDLNAGRR